MFGLSGLAMAAIGAFLLASVSFASGYKVEAWHRDSLEVKAQQLADLQIKQEQTKAVEASAALEKARQDAQEHIRIVTQTVDKIITRPVYRNVCLDADGLSAASLALQGPTATPGKSDKPLPGSKPIGGRLGSGSAPKAN